MRFSACILASCALHAVVLCLIPSVGPALWGIGATGEPAPVAVRVLDEPPIVANTPLPDPSAPPIFQPSDEARAFREGMGALSPEPRPRSRDERAGIAASDARRRSSDFGMSSSDAANHPSAPDPAAGSAIAPSETGPDRMASEAPAEGWGTEGTRFLPEGGALDPTRASAPGRPTGDIGTGTGPGGNAPEGAGPAAAPGGPPPAPEGPGTGVDAPGAGTAGPGTGAAGSGHSGSGSGSDEGGGGSSPPSTTPPATPPPARLVAVATPSFPPTKEMQRLEIHGTVSVRISIDASGAITSASVVSGSGHPSYDSQAAQWVRSHWRYSWVGGASEGGVTRVVQVRF